MTRAPYDTASCLAQLGNALADVRAATAAVSEARERRDRLMVRLVLDHGMSKYRVAKLAGLSDTYQPNSPTCGRCRLRGVLASPSGPCWIWGSPYGVMRSGDDRPATTAPPPETPSWQPSTLSYTALELIEHVAGCNRD